jgi:5-methylcytosine-specific restriction endonuclease McrA
VWVHRRLAKRQGNRCVYCGSVMTEPDLDGRTGPTTRSIDHYIPRSKGGPSSFRNMVLACHQCNGAKGDQLPLDFVVSKASHP